MKRPYYYLKEDISHSNANGDTFNFKSGMHVNPILNDNYLPNHLKEVIIERNKWKMANEPRYVMCSVGIFYIPVRIDKIKEVI